MKFSVKNNKSVVVPHSVDVNLENSILEQNAGSSNPDFTIQVPHMLGIAALESQANDEHFKEVQETLQDVAKEAAPKESEVKKMDIKAVGKERDYDYSHPIIKNMYTGKLVLEESLDETVEFPRPEGASDEDYKIRELRLDSTDAGVASVYVGDYEDPEAVRAFQIEHWLCISSKSPANGGIYLKYHSDADDVEVDEIDAKWNRTSVSEIESNIQKIKEKADITRNNLKKYCHNLAQADINKAISNDQMDAWKKAEQLAISEIDASGEYPIPSEEEKQEHRHIKDKEARQSAIDKDVEMETNRKKAIQTKKQELYTLVKSAEEYEADIAANEKARYDRGENAEFKKQGQSSITKTPSFYKTNHKIRVVTDDDGYKGACWNHYIIDGSVRATSTRRVTIPWMSRNKQWAYAAGFKEGELLYKAGDPLGLDFAERLLKVLQFKKDSFTPTNGATDVDLYNHPYIYNISGNRMDIYIAHGVLQIKSTQEVFNELADNLGRLHIPEVKKNQDGVWEIVPEKTKKYNIVKTGSRKSKYSDEDENSIPTSKNNESFPENFNVSGVKNFNESVLNICEHMIRQAKRNLKYYGENFTEKDSQEAQEKINKLIKTYEELKTDVESKNQADEELEGSISTKIGNSVSNIGSNKTM